MADDFGNPFAGLDPWTLRNLPLLQMAGQFGAGMLQGASAPPGERATFGRALGQGMQQGMGGMLQGVDMSRKIGQDQAWRQAVQSAPQEYRGVLSSLGPQHGAAMLGPLLAEQKNQQGLLNFGGGGGQPMPPMPPTPSMPPMPQAAGGGGPQGGGGDFMARLAASEGGTGPGAATARNPRSSATGPYQFIDSTWRDVAKNNPQQFGGLDDAEIMSARTNPGAARVGADWYAQQGAGRLQQGGAEVTPANLALHHRFGPQGAMALLRASPETPIANVLPPQVLQANPDLANQTVGALQQGLQRRFGGGQQGLSGPDGSPLMLPNGSRPATWADLNQARMSGNPMLREWAAGVMQQQQTGLQQRQFANQEQREAQQLALQERRFQFEQQSQPLEVVQGPNGPMNVPRTMAAGTTPAAPSGESERLMERFRQLQGRGTLASAAEQEEMQILRQRLAGGGTNVNVLPQERAEQKGTGEALAQEAAGVRTSADAAAGTLDTVRTIRAIGAETGRLAPATQAIGSFLDSMGIKGVEAVKQATSLQAFNAVAANFVLGKQIEQKGPQTDKDTQLIKTTMAQSTNTMEANDIIMRTVEAQAMRMMEKDRFYQGWRQQPGQDGQPRNSVDGAGQAWRQHLHDTPLVAASGNQLMFFNEYMERAVPRLNGDVGAAAQAWRDYTKGKR